MEQDGVREEVRSSSKTRSEASEVSEASEGLTISLYITGTFVCLRNRKLVVSTSICVSEKSIYITGDFCVSEKQKTGRVDLNLCQ